MSFFGIKGACFAFFRKRQDGSTQIFFSGFRRKQLFITTCIEKQCTQPLKGRQGLVEIKTSSLLVVSLRKNFTGRLYFEMIWQITDCSLTRKQKRSFRYLLVEVPWQINEQTSVMSKPSITNICNTWDCNEEFYSISKAMETELSIRHGAIWDESSRSYLLTDRIAVNTDYSARSISDCRR